MQSIRGWGWIASCKPVSQTGKNMHPTPLNPSPGERPGKGQLWKHPDGSPRQGSLREIAANHLLSPARVTLLLQVCSLESKHRCHLEVSYLEIHHVSLTADIPDRSLHLNKSLGDSRASDFEKHRIPVSIFQVKKVALYLFLSATPSCDILETRLTVISICKHPQWWWTLLALPYIAKLLLPSNSGQFQDHQRISPWPWSGLLMWIPSYPFSPSQVLPSLLSTRPTPHSQRNEFLRFTQISLQPPLFCSHSFTSAGKKPCHLHSAEQLDLSTPLAESPHLFTSHFPQPNSLSEIQYDQLLLSTWAPRPSYFCLPFAGAECTHLLTNSLLRAKLWGK